MEINPVFRSWLKAHSIASNNKIHPTAVIDPSASLGTGNTVGPFCYIGPNTDIGNNNAFEAHVCIGTSAEKDGDHIDGYVLIGHHNIFSEYSNVHRSTSKAPTTVGSHCRLMTNAYVAHDCLIECNVTLCCNVVLGGHCRVMFGATLGFGATLHPKTLVGSCSYLGMGTIVPKNTNIRPGEIYAGNPAVRLKINKIGLEKHEMVFEKLAGEIQRYEKYLGNPKKNGSDSVLRELAKQCGTSVFARIHNRIRTSPSRSGSKV